MNIDDDMIAQAAAAIGDEDEVFEEQPKKRGGWPKGKPRTARAEARTEDVRPGIRTRKRKGGTLVDKYAVPPGLIPAGMSWEWKTETVYGQADTSYMAFMREQGWEPVMADRYPGVFNEDSYHGPIRRDGLLLMERPIELTREAMAEERAAARDAVRIKEQQLHGAPDGQFQRQRADGSSTVAINRTIERGGLPIDN